ncbi:uncharacterized protein LOC142592783 isoform X4 [Dermacentor variabilis]|uniref:uncharacterized protein LOC142592783 isoform X4 n=1 Tax=Dermacentor variabilis TaxID=34621 RepID=UPI003F5CB4AF
MVASGPFSSDVPEQRTWSRLVFAENLWLRWRSSCQCSHAAPPSAKALMPLAQCPSVQ